MQTKRRATDVDKLDLSNKGKSEYTDKEGHWYPGMESFRRSDSLQGKQIDQEESEWKRKSDKISSIQEIKKRKQNGRKKNLLKKEWRK